MTDLDLTKACAEAMGMEVRADKVIHRTVSGHPFPVKYNPLRDDTQAMALAKRFALGMDKNRVFNEWHVICANEKSIVKAQGANADLNRAICECVAKMQAAKAPQ